VAAFDRTTAQLLELVAANVAAAPAEPEPQVRSAIETFVRALGDDPRKARLVFTEAPSAGAEVERPKRAILRSFAELVTATARQHVPSAVPEDTLRMGALSLVGAIERVMIEWQDGELDASLEQVVDHLVGFFLAAGAALGVRP